MKELRCRDVGFDCEKVLRAESEEEILRQAAEHAGRDHGLTELTPETARQVASKIRTT
ncbi:MAG TPA: DUF1059 domain-containing protein [Gemmatimonadales bacterium]|nr:DUF1059 domain-containing protein [Gemmatimonadales bacterium]